MNGKQLADKYMGLQMDVLKHFAHRLPVTVSDIREGSLYEDMNEGTDMVLRFSSVRFGFRVRELDRYGVGRRQEYADQITLRARGAHGGRSEVQKLMENIPGEFADYGLYTCLLDGKIYRATLYSYAALRESIKWNPRLFSHVVDGGGWIDNRGDRSAFVPIRLSELPKGCVIGRVGAWFSEAQQALAL